MNVYHGDPGDETPAAPASAVEIPSQIASGAEPFAYLREQGTMACVVCGKFSSARTCWDCSLIVTGNHPALRIVNDEHTALRAEVERLRGENALLTKGHIGWSELCALELTKRERAEAERDTALEQARAGEIQSLEATETALTCEWEKQKWKATAKRVRERYIETLADTSFTTRADAVVEYHLSMSFYSKERRQQRRAAAGRGAGEGEG